MKVYLDNAATTPMAPEVIEVMTNVMHDNYGNPSSTHSFGRSTKVLIENSRRTIAQYVNCEPSEIIFTSGGTEADNMALRSAVNSLGVKRVITSPLEHHAVLHTADALNNIKNIKIDYVKVDENGNVDLDDLQRLLQESDLKTLVSLMHANNEIGTLLPIKKVSQICRENEAYFHSDTVQTMGHYAFDLKDLDIDFITCAGHKFHGPKGVGFLYINKKTRINSLIYGGAQERGLRGGTENVYGIVGLAKAMDLAYADVKHHEEQVQELKTYMMQELQRIIPGVEFHGETNPEKSLYTVLNVCFPKNDKSSMLLFTLDIQGVACSGGSACSSGSSKGSHVLGGINADMDRPNARFSFSRYTTKEEIDYALQQIESIYKN